MVGARVFRPAKYGYGWEVRLVTLVGFIILLVWVMPGADGMTDNALAGLLLVAIFILVYGFVAGRLLAVTDRIRKPRAQPPE